MSMNIRDYFRDKGKIGRIQVIINVSNPIGMQKSVVCVEFE